jgi:hypothetical protein
MPEEQTSTNQVINTTQPRPLRGLKLRGVKKIPTIETVKKGAGPDGEDLYMTINEEDYDKELHGEKVDKLPTRGKKASAEKEDDSGEEEEEEEEAEEEE